MYQFETSSMPSGIGGHQQQDVVVEDAQSLGVVAAQQVVGLDEESLRIDALGGVQAAIDPHHRLAFGGQRVRLVVGQILGARQALGDLFVPRQVLQIGGRTDNCFDNGAALGRLADLHQLDAIGLLGQLIPVFE